MSLTLGIDLDGCTYDFTDALRQWINLSIGRPLSSMPDSTCWHFYESDWSMTLEEFLYHFHAGVNAGYIFAAGGPMVGAAEGLHRLKGAGHRLIAITDRGNVGRPGLSKRLTLDWITRYQLPFDELHVSADKTIVHTDLFIDDRIENYDALEAIGVTPYLLDRPWNQGADRRRVYSWDEFCDVVDAVDFYCTLGLAMTQTKPRIAA